MFEVYYFEDDQGGQSGTNQDEKDAGPYFQSIEHYDLFADHWGESQCWYPDVKKKVYQNGDIYFFDFAQDKANDDNNKSWQDNIQDIEHSRLF